LNYNNLTWRHFETVSHAGRLAGDHVRRGAAGSRANGTWVQFEVRVGASVLGASILDEVRFLAYGCPHVIAVADWIAGQSTGRSAEPKLPENVHELQRRFEVPTPKLGRLLILEDAWIAALSSEDAQIVRGGSMRGGPTGVM
jgi:hypothetical protein